ncbi:hypothetical protein COCSADRAFT_90707 [Bipolaris sorokiniana ND90Pr]|nr:uncharacterized protein COCSADRAFT_90707 [Bipolaris sorokiniana ND90Pr]EMD63840.1 hypothetical protein COCSADRAFT_90707 [Bipolaris sorokiniana ND90Pr]
MLPGTNSSLPPISLGGIAIVLLVSLILKFRNVGTRGKDMPPGPNTTLILGNVLDFPTSLPHIKFLKWTRQYGDIFSLKIFDRTIIVISSPIAVKHILETNGARTGNRPQSKIANRVTRGQNMFLESMENPVWKRGSQLVRNFLTRDSLEKDLKTQEDEISQCMHDMLEDPKNFYRHVCRTTASVILTNVYGVRVAKYEGSVAETYFLGTKLLSESLDPGAHPPIDLFWPLQYVPKRWAYWKRLADSARTVRDELYGSLYAQCELAVKSKNFTGCHMESLVSDQAKLGMTRDEIIGIGAVLMDAGVKTTATFIHSFIIALINYPGIQRKAQKEIDTVVGPDRWPRLKDYENVPYIRAIVDEVIRFKPSAPVAIPHVSTAEVCYKGYRIPKDSTIFLNVHGISHDPDFFDHPEEFRPERFLETEFGTKPGVDTTGFRNNFTFGAGRRACPGEALARQNMALTIMNFLWAFDFKKDDSGTGGYDLDSYERPGIELAPKEFTCGVLPRSVAKAEMIRNRMVNAYGGTQG